MTRRSYVQIEGVLYEKGTEPARESYPQGPAILPDLPDFTSPIDGVRYSGRAGLREHCRKHDVVPNADLVGLPVLTATSDTRRPEDVRRDKQARKEQLNRLFTPHYT